MLRLQSERCRLCGIHNYDLINVKENLAARIKILFHLQIKTNNEKDKLPKYICNNCVLSVGSCWKFYLLIHKVQHELTRECYIKEELLIDYDIPSTDDNFEDYPLKIDKVKALDKVEMDKIIEPEDFVADNFSEACNDKADDVKLVTVDTLRGGTKELPIVFSNNEQINNQKSEATEKVIRPRKRLIMNRVKRKSNVCPSKSAKNKVPKAKEMPLGKDKIWLEYPWWCLTCRSNFDKQDAFNRHLCFKKRHCYYCVDCSKAFMIYNRLIIHVKQFHWDRLRTHILCQCDLCNRSFHSTEEQETHRQQIHPVAEKRAEPEMPQYFSLTCLVCNKTFSNRDSLKQHSIIHSDELSHVCDTCGRSFRYASGLKEHVIRYHTTDEVKLQCDQCGKMFATQGNLNAHMIMHLKERPYTCEICHKSFKKEYYLKIHKVKHSSEKSHMCEICGKGFNCKSNLKGHRKIHTLERTHKCSYCEKAFKTKVHLISHERQHTGEQPYSCTVCDKKFTCYGNRIKHMRRIHKILTAKENKNGGGAEQE